MSAPLYNAEILRLAASIPHHERLVSPMGSVEKRSPVCGSRVTVDIDLDEHARVIAVGMSVRACALGQASSSLLAAHIVGRQVGEIGDARDKLADWLAGSGALPSWPGLAIFEPARAHTARHASIRLAFEAAADAAAQAAMRARAA